MDGSIMDDTWKELEDMDAMLMEKDNQFIVVEYICSFNSEVYKQF